MALQHVRAFLFVLVVKFFSSASSLPQETIADIFYPFGSDVGDSVVPVSDGISAAGVSIDTVFPFFNSSYRTVFVNNDGVLSFNGPVKSTIPEPFPIAEAALIAPFWADVDTTANSGRVYYRQTTDKELLDRAAADIESAFNPHFRYLPRISWIFVATWHNVTYFGGNATSPVQTFQAVIATDGVHSFALFNYGTLLWTHGPTNNVPALVGFSAGDMINYYEILTSRTPEVLSVYLAANGGSPGRWAFRFDRVYTTQTSRGPQKQARVVEQTSKQPKTVVISDGNVYPFGLLDIDADRGGGDLLQVMVCSATLGSSTKYIALQHERFTVNANVSSNDRGFTFARQIVNITGNAHNAVIYDVYPKGFLVLADDDVRTFVVQVQYATTDGYFVLPVTPGSTEFFVAGWLSQRSGVFYSGVQVTSAYPDTLVDFYRVSGDRYTLLNSSYLATSRSSALFIVSFGADTTGLYVNSSRPIGVTAAAMCANVPTINVSACDFMAEQMPPVSELGTVHVVPPITGRSVLAGYLVRVVATELDTVVSWSSLTSVQPAGPVNLTRGHFVQINVLNTTEPLLVTCSRRCLVMQYNKGGDAAPADSSSTDPFMMLTTPVDHFASETCFMTANTMNNFRVLIEYKNNVSIVALTGDLGAILLDGEQLITSNSSVRLRQTIGDYTVYTRPIAHGSHRIDVARGSNAKFAAYVYGHSSSTYTAYGYPAVYAVSSLPPGYAPTFARPQLVGPVVKNRLWFEFYCVIPVISANGSARFEIQFTFDGVARSDVPVFTVNTTNPRATLHERYLNGKLDSSVGCEAVSYWIETPAQRSRTVGSANTYKAGLQASAYFLSTTEGDTEPINLTLSSTLPITCQSTDSRGQPINCLLSFAIDSSEDIAVGQRGNDPNAGLCSYVLRESDWDSANSRAYNGISLDIKAKRDIYVTGVRQNWVQLTLPILPYKTINGTTYQNPWSGYRMKQAVRVDRYDEPLSVTCRSSGDPHITTFDGLYYHSFAVGTFVYVRSKSGLPFEVQVRHAPCSPGSTVACICGVALREGEYILVVYKCKQNQYEQGEAPTRFITFDRELPTNAGITKTGNGYGFMMKMPSGNKVIGDEYSWGLNIEIIMAGKRQTSGLCGSFDNNQANDMTRANGTIDPPVYSGFAPDFVESWRVNSGYTLFDNYLEELPIPSEPTPGFCLCSASVPTCGSNAVQEPGILPGEPNVPIKPRIPASVDPGNDDMVDHTYDPAAFNETRINAVVPHWPTSNGITEAQAEAGCTSRIFNNATISPMCYDSLAAEYVASVIQKCVDDVQVSGSFAWAGDKIPEIQRTCINNVLTKNYTDVNDTATVVDQVIRDVQSVVESTCEPADCNGHGTCKNGTCICNPDYTGADCAVSASAIPEIRELLDPPDCDVRTKLCQSVYLTAVNFTTNVACKIQILQTGVATRAPATIQSRTTLVCPLPTEPLSLFSSRTDFTALHGAGFDFNKLPQGSGGQLTYLVSVSNDGLRYSAARTIRVIDSVCMNCGSSGCTRKPNTCMIHGYCFSAGAANPYNKCYSCSPRQKQNLWKLTGKKKKCCKKQKKQKKCRRFI